MGHHDRRTRSPEERFWSKVDRSGSCWLWTGMRDADGYGWLRRGRAAAGHHFRAHRFSYELHHGPIAPGMSVMHTCDVPACVNPAHLMLGTNRDNARDAARKGRMARGSRHPQSKLTEDQVRDLRARRATGEITQRQLAAEYGISEALVSTIVSRKAWRHI